MLESKKWPPKMIKKFQNRVGSKKIQNRVWPFLSAPGDFWGVPMAFLGEKMRFPNFRHHHPIFRSFFRPYDVKNEHFLTPPQKLGGVGVQKISKSSLIISVDPWRLLGGVLWHFCVKKWDSQIFVITTPFFDHFFRPNEVKNEHFWPPQNSLVFTSIH